MAVCCLTVLIAVTHDTDAADIRRVRCRIRTVPPRVNIQVAARNLLPNQSVTASVTNPAGVTVNCENPAVCPVNATPGGDAALVWDTDNVAGQQTFISGDFAGIGDTVTGRVFDAVTGVLLAQGDAVCQ